ncbi:hypothetical protein LTR27_004150 [Elasticomyces elasticus]|nr:hypothetical protein LTR27_004150 [Elasticomyces elasticus]
MAPKIFITGITGYIGGDLFEVLYKKHPDYDYSVLVRTQEKSDVVTKAYPRVKVILGGLDDLTLVEREAAKADVIIHTAESSEHEGAAKAIAAGLAPGHSKERPGYWLNTGGTGILTFDDSSHQKLGDWSDLEYNDWTGVHDLTHLPDEAMHRNVDKIVLEAGTKYSDSVKTAIVCPPTIYGNGRGQVNQRSRQIYDLASFVLKHQWVPIIGGGKARWKNLHIYDLSDAFVLLIEAAVAGNNDPELWGANGYLIVEHGEHTWSDIAGKIGTTAHKLGYLDAEPKVKVLHTFNDVLKEVGYNGLGWAWNARAKGERLSKVLRWEPSGPTLEVELEEIVKREYERGLA